MKLKLRLSRRSPAQLLKLAGAMLAATADNPHFPEAGPRLDAVSAAAEELRHTGRMIAKVETALRTLRGKHHANTADLRAALDGLGNHLKAAARGDAEKLRSAGVEMRRGNSRIGPLPAVTQLRLRRTGLAGSLRCRWKAVHGARSYHLQISVHAEGPWEDLAISTRCWHVVNDLAPGTACWIRVTAVGAAGAGGASAPVRLLAA